MKTTRRVVLASLLIALAVSLGYAFAGIPNIEFMTLTVFVSGFLLRSRLGALVGASAIGLHSLFNPLGAAMPPLLVAQVLGFALVGVAGAAVGPAIVRLSRVKGTVVAGASGLLVTLCYDLLTNVGAFFSITSGDIPARGLAAFVVAGIAFSATHLVWNTALFLLTLTPTLNVLARYRVELD